MATVRRPLVLKDGVNTCLPRGDVLEGTSFALVPDYANADLDNKLFFADSSGKSSVEWTATDNCFVQVMYMVMGSQSGSGYALAIDGVVISSSAFTAGRTQTVVIFVPKGKTLVASVVMSGTIDGYFIPAKLIDGVTIDALVPEHNSLTGRGNAGAHPTNAITGLDNTLAGLNTLISDKVQLFANETAAKTFSENNLYVLALYPET
jgi:hypothetical protein